MADNEKEIKTDDSEKNAADAVEATTGDGSITSAIEEAKGQEDESAIALDAARKEAKDTYERLLRVSAEFDNYKKRSTREIDSFRKFANESLIKSLLFVLDNLERAIDSSVARNENSGIVEGVKMTLKEMLKIFEQYGVAPIESIGKPFDPGFYEAAGVEESDDHPENTVIKEFQKGYMMHDRLLRPAMVIVSRVKEKSGKENSNNPDQSDSEIRI